MARAKLTDSPDDLVSDSGAVLISMIIGEQLEFPITLNFVSDVTVAGFEFEAALIEAANVVNQTARPTAVDGSSPVKTSLTVRLPDLQGAWSAPTAYNYNEVVLYNGVYYSLTTGAGYISATTPNLDPRWAVTSLSTIVVELPSTLGSTYSVLPDVSFNTYGFLEVRVTEPANSVFRRTWKPVRGMIEFLFSPTAEVP